MFSMLTSQQWLGVGLLALYAVFRLFGAQLSAAASSAWNRPWFTGSVGGQTVAPTVIIDQDTADFQALSRLQARYKRQQCPEGMAAVDTCLTHFWHGSGPSA